MIRSRTFASAAIFALAAPTAASELRAGDYVVAGAVRRIADRCVSQYGEGFFDNGNGVCTRVRPHTRIYVSPPQNAGMHVWSNGGTSNAAVVTTQGTMLVPGTPTQHLRVRGNLDSYSPFR